MGDRILKASKVIARLSSLTRSSIFIMASLVTIAFISFSQSVYGATFNSVAINSPTNNTVATYGYILSPQITIIGNQSSYSYKFYINNKLYFSGTATNNTATNVGNVFLGAGNYELILEAISGTNLYNSSITYLTINKATPSLIVSYPSSAISNTINITINTSGVSNGVFPGYPSLSPITAGEIVNEVGNGVYTMSVALPGTYYFNVLYPGDANYSSVSAIKDVVFNFQQVASLYAPHSQAPTVSIVSPKFNLFNLSLPTMAISHMPSYVSNFVSSIMNAINSFISSLMSIFII
jgi:hypothetical protein